MGKMVAAALAIVCATPEMAMAQAQDQQPAQGSAPASDNTGEIIVTAQKRSERLQDVPIAISVQTQAQLESKQANTIFSLARLTPALEIQRGQTGASVGGGGQIRGIGTISRNQGAAPAVGIVVDQVSQGTTNISDLFDIARVEVLKGPQGTLFGLTTSAGVINIVTNKPEFNRFSARVRTELSSSGVAGSDYGNQVVQGMINVPVAANAALRLTGNGNLQQGVDRNAYTGKLVRQNSFGFRGRFLWEPTSNVTVNLIGDYTKADASGVDFFTVTQADPNFGGGAQNPFNVVGALASCGITVTPANRDYCSRNRNDQHSKTYGASAQIDLDVRPFIVTSITAYRGQDTGPNYNNIFRIDPFPLQVQDGPVVDRNSLFSQEFRLASHSGARLEYTAGVFYSDSRQHNNPDPSNVFVFGNGVNPQNGVDIQINDTSMAVFGQSTLHLGDHLRLIGGARFTQQRLSVDYKSLDVSVVDVPTASGYLETNISNFSWKVGAQYEFSRNLQVYTTVSRGYKGPQIALGDPTAITVGQKPPPGSEPSIVAPEIPTSYEIGAKGNFLDNRLSIDLSLFYEKVENYQTTATLILNRGLNIIPVPANIPSITSKGIELNISARPVEGLSFNVGAIYNPVKYPSGFAGEDGSDLSGAQLKYVPEYKATASGEYEHRITGGINGFLNMDLVYKSDLRLDVRNFSEPKYAIDSSVIYPAHVTLGGRIGLRAIDDRWTVAIFARNLTENHEPTFRIPQVPPAFGVPSNTVSSIFSPNSFRQVGLSLDGRF